MPISEEITEFQSFTDRTLKYGRNMMVAALPIIVFAFVGAVELGKSRPFNFKIKPDGELAIWWMMLAVLLYYGVRFFWLAFLDFGFWRHKFGHHISELGTTLTKHLKLEVGRRENFDKADINAENARLKQARDSVEEAKFSIGAYNRRRAYFWVTDFCLPTAIFVGAVIGAFIKIYRLMNAPV